MRSIRGGERLGTAAWRRNSSATFGDLRRFVRQELLKEGAYLLPLRLFIGWLRAAAEKMIDPGWYDGSALRAFLGEQLTEGLVVFPFYRAFVDGVFVPAAPALSWVIMVGQLLAGAAILVGLYTNAALLGGLFMNLNFILAGAVDPSAFSFVIQVALFVGGVGAIVGFDSLLSRTNRNVLLVAQNGYTCRYFRRKKRVFLGLTFLALAVAALSFTRVSTFDPGLSVEDPAMILVVLFGLFAVTAFVSYLRQRPPEAAAGAPVAGPDRMTITRYERGTH